MLCHATITMALTFVRRARICGLSFLHARSTILRRLAVSASPPLGDRMGGYLHRSGPCQRASQRRRVEVRLQPGLCAKLRQASGRSSCRCRPLCDGRGGTWRPACPVRPGARVLACGQRTTVVRDCFRCVARTASRPADSADGRMLLGSATGTADGEGGCRPRARRGVKFLRP